MTTSIGAVAFVLNRLNADSELVAMTSAGVAPFAIFRPLLLHCERGEADLAAANEFAFILSGADVELLDPICVGDGQAGNLLGQWRDRAAAALGGAQADGELG